MVFFSCSYFLYIASYCDGEDGDEGEVEGLDGDSMLFYTTSAYFINISHENKIVYLDFCFYISFCTQRTCSARGH